MQSLTNSASDGGSDDIKRMQDEIASLKSQNASLQEFIRVLLAALVLFVAVVVVHCPNKYTIMFTANYARARLEGTDRQEWPLLASFLRTALRPAHACPPAPVVRSSESHPRWSPTVNRVKPCAPRGSLWNRGSPMRLSEFTRSSHTRLPTRRAHDYALPLARRANRQPPPCSTVLCRSLPHACALNCPLPLARLPTSANCPCASLQSGSFRAGPPYNYLLTLAQLPTATLTPVRLRGVGCRARFTWGLVGAVLGHNIILFQNIRYFIFSYRPPARLARSARRTCTWVHGVAASCACTAWWWWWRAWRGRARMGGRGMARSVLRCPPCRLWYANNAVGARPRPL
mgnify:CR=1 FL=1